MAYEYQWSLKTQPAIQKLLLKNSIKSIHPPYLLDSKYRYDFYLLSEISRLIKELRIEVFEEKYHLVSFSEMDKMDDQKILNIADSFMALPTKRLDIFNAEEMRLIEKNMILLHNSIMHKSEEFDRYIKNLAVERSEPFNENWRDIKATLFGIKWKKIQNIGQLKCEIFGVFSDVPSFHNEYGHTYLKKENFDDAEHFLNNSRDTVKFLIRKFDDLKLLYLSNFKILECDPLSGDRIVIDIIGSQKRLFTSESLKYVDARAKKIRDERNRAGLINLFRNNLPGRKIEIGGDVYLYYIRVKYKNREKYFYKIGITQRKLQERYPGKEYQKISKVLFFDRVINAPEIESAIKLQFVNHSIPLDFFRSADGKTEFFDIDVLGLDIQ
jgi:hypothetical protein